MTRAVDRLTAAGVALAVAGVPLAMLPGGHSPFGPTKMLVTFVAAGLVAAGLALDRGTVAASRVRGALRSPVAWALAAYAGLSVLSLVTAVDARAAVAGSYPGYTGLLALAAWLVLACGVASLGAERARSLAGRAAAVAVLAVSAYALAQLAGLDPVAWPEALDLERVRSSLGNASNLGAWLACALPLAADRALAERTGAWRWCALAALPAGALTLAATGSRGALVALAVACAVAGVLAWRGRGAGALTDAPARWALGAAAALLVAGALWAPGAGARLSGGGTGEGTARGRVAVWRSTLPMIAARPFLGWGPGAYGRVHPAYATSAEADPYGRDSLLDDPHNALLSAAAASGVPAAAALMWLAVAATLAAWRRPDVWWSAAGLAGLGAAVQFHFVTLDTGAAGAVLLGCVLAVEAQRLPAAAGRLTGGRLWRPAWTAGELALAALAVAAVGGVGADRAAARGLAASGSDWPTASAAFARAERLAPWEPAYVWAHGRGARDAVLAGEGDALAEGRAALAEAAARMPRDFRVPRDAGDLELVAAVGGQGAGTASLAGAQRSYAEALALAPTDARSLLGLGAARLQSGDAVGSLEPLRRAADLAPLMPETWDNLALAYEAAGRPADAAEARRKAGSLGN